jgi:hypothetical protein
LLAPVEDLEFVAGSGSQRIGRVLLQEERERDRKIVERNCCDGGDIVRVSRARMRQRMQLSDGFNGLTMLVAAMLA